MVDFNDDFCAYVAKQRLHCCVTNIGFTNSIAWLPREAITNFLSIELSSFAGLSRDHKQISSSRGKNQASRFLFAHHKLFLRKGSRSLSDWFDYRSYYRCSNPEVVITLGSVIFIQPWSVQQN